MSIRLQRPVPVFFERGMSIVFVIFLFLSLFLPNGIYLLGGLITLLFLIKTQWNIYTPGILIFIFTFQWIQVITFPLWMNIQGKPMNGLSPSAPLAFVISMTGFTVMAIIARTSIRSLQVYSKQDFIDDAMLVNQKKLLFIYSASTIFLSGIGFVFGITSGFTQILISISSIKWIFLLWLSAVVWVRNTYRWWLVIIIFYEFSTGLYSYFSDFKEVIFYVIILSLTFITRIRFAQFFSLSMVGLLLVFFMLTWTFIKGGYRAYLNQGTKQQIINVSRSDALSNLAERVQAIRAEDYQKAISMAAYRLQYLYHLSLAMDRVPSRIPHQNGGVWGENISYVLTPRILNPNKKIYTASIKASQYTGKQFAGLKDGSSFSLGYFADCYIDFGPIGMLLALAVIAYLIAGIYKIFYNFKGLSILLRFAIVNVVLFEFILFESDGLFLFGRTLTNFLVLYFLSKYVFPHIQKWVYNR